MIDPTFRNINSLLVLSFKNATFDSMRDYFNNYYIPLVEIKEFNGLTENKPIFDQPVKHKQEKLDVEKR